jgi:uncharacterized protein YfaS (alpha-2-macroglobulin family)
MRRTTLLLSCCLFLSLLFALRFSAATPVIRVNEKATTLDLSGTQSVVALAVENVSGREVRARITLELVDTKNKVKARGESRAELQTGEQSLRLSLPFNFKELNASDLNEFPLYRLRYSIIPYDVEGKQGVATEGIISLSEITPELFELRISAARRAREGMRYRVRVQATHPFTRLPVSGIQLAGEIALDAGSKEVLLQARAITDAEGNAALDFNLPASVKDKEASISVTGRLNVFEQEAKATLEFDDTARILVTADKPLYQPGQTLHLRALVLDPSGHALPSASASFKVEDPDNTTVFRATSNTTRLGIATADWEIPENTRLGDYTIKVELEEGRFEDSMGYQIIKISRYDLPNFTVSAKADRAYYLPNQNAEVEVRADYLFGQPVKRGTVRVVRESERRWNFQQQQWETEEGQEIKGELDQKGRFVARINLQQEYKKLSEESYERFRDASYAAYLTDASTNRTEQRRFSLRLTKEPIHIYVTEGSYDQAEGMPLTFYVAASYADGNPAQCEISVAVSRSDSGTSSFYGKDAPLANAARAATVSLVKTNRYGVAKITGGRITLDNFPNRYLSVRLSARDRQGRAGHQEEGLWLKDSSVVRVETDKAVYRPGEPVRALIFSNTKDAILSVDVVNDLKVIRSEAVRLEHGQASITFPYGKDFDGKLSVVASFYEQEEKSYAGDEVTGRHTILYPRDRELKLDVKVGQAVYRPGEEAQATLRAMDADGRSLESVFGVVVFDKAVEERARTDAEFGSPYGFYDYFRYFRYGSSFIAGIGLRELERLDVKRKPVPEDLNTLADMLLQHESTDYELTSFESNAYKKNQAEIFGVIERARLEPVKKALDARYDRSTEYPADAAALRSFLKEAQIDFDQLRDPWSMPYRATFAVEGASDTIGITSAGADKEFGTRDDFTVLKLAWPYFRPVGERIDAVVNGYHARTGSFIRDEATLRAELSRAGVNPDALIDRWGQPYILEFDTMGVLLAVRLRSGGADKHFDPEYRYNSDDFTIWTTWVDSFSERREEIDRALSSYQQATGKFPQDEASFREALTRAGIERDRLLDPFGRRYLVSFNSESRYVDRVVIESRYGTDGKQEQRTKIVPVSQRVFLITLFSTGEDGRGGTGDDFNAATLTSIAYEQAANEANAQPVKPLTTFVGATGALTGTVTDSNGAVVPGVNVIAVNTYSSAGYSATTNDNGVYLLRNLPPGMYTVSMSATGFATIRTEGVPVRSSTLIKVDGMLLPAGISSTVNVTSASEPQLNTTSNSTATSVTVVYGGMRRGQLSTPRLREYFPETLVWQPALETDTEGRALLRFRLADNITTWKMSIIGSTADGEIGTAEKEIRAFQPFFVEHDPPRVLTEGDEIALPVVLRNYLDRAQAVDLEIKPENWFSLTGAAQKRAEVGAGDSAREVFSFRATKSVKDGQQRITARGEEASDAIDRPVTVHPDGEERAATDSRVFTDTTVLEADIPAEAIKGTLRGELKIYPSLIGHLFESIEGIMARPYGCGEQTISSTYPSLLALRAYKRNGAVPSEKTGARAQRYLRSGYERLLNYRAESGGFSYWGGSATADLALTAYALRFLHDAEEFVEVDEDVTDSAREWLVDAQRTDGSWPDYLASDRTKETGSAMATALIARTLALYEKKGAKARDANAQAGKTTHDALMRALSFLDRKVEEIDEPYLIASYALASLDAGDNERAARALARLRRLSLNEGDGSYWSLETNTPFYGWGLAGRIETTALVLQALARGAKAQDDALLNRGLLFLLKQKDRYGVWYSTQATVNVLDALIALLSTSTGAPDNTPGEAAVSVNGKPAGTIQMPSALQLTGPLTLDISKFLDAGNNRLEIKRTGGALSSLSAQVVANYYLPWTRALADETKQKSASPLKLTVNFDKTEAGVTDEVTCRVKAERVGFSGYGMLLAEVGLPPGADVDRASLERAMKESDWSFTRYDILPDRLVVYLWPSAGGTAFEFRFRTRLRLNALTAPSVLYDYYNPEAHASLAPVRFVVK